MSDLLDTLKIAVYLSSNGPTNAAGLMAELGVSKPTLARRVADLRHMGAQVEVYRDGDWLYRITNWPEIEQRTLRWIELEESRDLRAANDG